MFTKMEFAEFIDSWTLQFHRPSHEFRYMKSKEELFHKTIMRKVIVLMAAVMTVDFSFLAHNHYQRGETYLAFCAVLAIVAGDLGLILELTLHRFECLKVLRGFCLSVSLHFCSSFYPTRLLPTPSFLPGYDFCSVTTM